MKTSCFTPTNLIFKDNMSVYSPQRKNKSDEDEFDHPQNRYEYPLQSNSTHSMTNSSDFSSLPMLPQSTQSIIEDKLNQLKELKQKLKESEKEKKPKKKSGKKETNLTRHNIADRKYPKIRLTKETLDMLKVIKDQTEYKSFTDLMNDMIAAYLRVHPTINVVNQSVTSNQSDCQISTDL